MLKNFILKGVLLLAPWGRQKISGCWAELIAAARFAFVISASRLALKRRFEVILSTVILNEIHKNLIGKFDVTPKAASRIRYRLAQLADLYEPRGEVKLIADDHQDNLVLETAWLGRAKYLVTGDREHLLPLKRFKHVRIIEPAQFLIVLRN